MFSPPSIIKNTMIGDESTSLHSILSLDNTPGVNSSMEDQISLSANADNKVQHKELSHNPHSYSMPVHSHSNMNSYSSDINHDTMTFYTNMPNNVLNNTKNDHKSNMLLHDSTSLSSFTNNTSHLNTYHSNTSQQFARLNAERYKVIASSQLNKNNRQNCLKNITNTANHRNAENILAPRETLANAFANHIYKVTNQKPSTSTIDSILSQKISQNRFCNTARQDVENYPANWSDSQAQNTNKDTEANENVLDFWSGFSPLL